MIDPNASAFPAPDDYGQDGNPIYGPKAIHGMTIRATMAKDFMSGLLSNSGGPIQANGMNGWNFVNCDVEGVAQVAIACADALIAELNKTEAES